ncbi:SRPBCC family protein [Saccharothrix sp. ST-888]|uniref:SRPBCC family protein n=1 Tax=Saccharothrix sp. ST-888 TaxID=1427391 RepID=UPI0005ECABE8|nr:SRPBCC family protein [Saccharothrix sp. ST-888]KJK57377.1 cyclase [Saccharothrix sp. ST-888]
MPSFEVVTVVDGAAPQQVFDAALDAELHTRSMGASGEQVVGTLPAGGLGPGDQVTFAARHFGVRWRLTAVVAVYEPPVRFVDEQVRGPFKRWFHEHEFTPNGTDGAGGTVMTDRVSFESPLGPLGRIADALVLRRYMAHLIRTRGRYLAEVLRQG